MEILVESYVDEKGPHLNLLTIQKKIKKSANQQAGRDSTHSGKKFVIETLSVSEMKVSGVMTIPGGGSWPVDLSVPAFEIEGIGEKKNGIVMAQVVVIILDAVIDKAIEDGSIEALPRMGKKTIENIKDAISFSEQSGERTPIGRGTKPSRICVVFF